MKSIVLSAMICAAAVGNSTATPYYTASHVEKGGVHEMVNDQKSTEAFKQTIAFHQRNVDALWEQYRLAETRIRESYGNHAELERDRVFFIGVYEQDIEKGVRVEESKKVIAQIEANYVKKHAQRDTYEKEQLTRLQSQLKTELLKEEKGFEKTKKRYAKLVNEETKPLLQEADRHFAAAIERVNRFSDAATAIAAK